MLGGAHALNFSGLSSNEWPLIGYLCADEVYRAKYDTYVKAVVNGPFNAGPLQSLYASYGALIEPYATAERSGFTFLNNSASFQSAITTLQSHVAQRATAVENYL